MYMRKETVLSSQIEGTQREWLALTPAGANQIVSRLQGVGLLCEITGYARNRRFRFEPYLRLFDEGRQE